MDRQAHSIRRNPASRCTISNRPTSHHQRMKNVQETVSQAIGGLCFFFKNQQLATAYRPRTTTFFRAPPPGFPARATCGAGARRPC